jgi:SAM-dependent methyltransferase
MNETEHPRATAPEPEVDSEYWARYYAVTVDRPAWTTVLKAIELFAHEDSTAPTEDPTAAARSGGSIRFAVDLGCGGGRDARALLRAGWRVLAMDREPGALKVLEEAAGPELGRRLRTSGGDFATFEVPPCDLVNASLCLPFVELAEFEGMWARIVAALPPGGRFSAMVFGDRDGSAGEAGMTCLPATRFKELLSGFDIELWTDTEEDKPTALGEPHHFHLIEFVARKRA